MHVGGGRGRKQPTPAAWAPRGCPRCGGTLGGFQPSNHSALSPRNSPHQPRFLFLASALYPKNIYQATKHKSGIGDILVELRVLHWDSSGSHGGQKTPRGRDRNKPQHSSALPPLHPIHSWLLLYSSWERGESGCSPERLGTCGNVNHGAKYTLLLQAVPCGTPAWYKSSCTAKQGRGSSLISPGGCGFPGRDPSGPSVLPGTLLSLFQAA